MIHCSCCYLPDAAYPDNGGEAGGEGVAAEGGPRVHGAHDLHPLKPHPLQLVVMEPSVRQHLHETHCYTFTVTTDSQWLHRDLLQECDELAGAPLVWLGQVEVLQEQDEPLAVPRPVHPARVGGDHHAYLQAYTHRQGNICTHWYIHSACRTSNNLMLCVCCCPPSITCASFCSTCVAVV